VRWPCGGDAPESESRDTIPPMPVSPTEVLRGWCADGSASLDSVVGALAHDDDAVDAFLAEEAGPLRFAERLIGDHVFELGFAVDDGPPIPARRWLSVARLSPVPFAWNVEPEVVLPLNDAATAQEFEALLVGTLGSRENRSALLSWLAHPDFLSSVEAIDRIEAALAAQGAGLTWTDRLATIKALSKRGGGWEAARALERLVTKAPPDLEDARAIQKVAIGLIDPTLFTVLAGQSNWQQQKGWLQELAAKLPSDELVAAFAPESGESRARRQLEPPGPAHRAAWTALARRKDRTALDAVGRLLVRASLFLRDDLLAAELIGATRATHHEAAVGPLTCAFLSGLHRTGPGPSIERFLRDYPEKALSEALGLLPDWLHTFDENAMVRLCFRLLPKTDEEGRARLADLAEIAGGTRARILLDELEQMA